MRQRIERIFVFALRERRRLHGENSETVKTLIKEKNPQDLIRQISFYQ